jgi:hypothetical protein
MLVEYSNKFFNFFFDLRINTGSNENNVFKNENDFEA